MSMGFVDSRESIINDTSQQNAVSRSASRVLQHLTSREKKLVVVIGVLAVLCLGLLSAVIVLVVKAKT